MGEEGGGKMNAWGRETRRKIKEKEVKIPEESYSNIYQEIANKCQKLIERLSEFWNMLLKLVISCSMGLLFGSITFVTLPFFKENYTLSLWGWGLSWLGLLAAIVFLIIAFLQEAYFLAMNLKKMDEQLRMLLDAKEQQKKFLSFKYKELIGFAPLINCALGFLCFLWGTIGIVGSVLNLFLSDWTLWIVLIVLAIDIIVLVWVIWLLISFKSAGERGCADE